MSDDTSATFLKSLASQLASNSNFVSLVAKHVASQLTGGRAAAPAKAAPAPAAAPARRGPGRPPKAAAPSAGGGGGAKSSSNVERVLEAIRGGAGTKKDIMSRAKVTNAGYSYALKTLRERRQIRIQGTRRAAIITVA